jgi:hypothetical protein
MSQTPDIIYTLMFLGVLCGGTRAQSRTQVSHGRVHLDKMTHKAQGAEQYRDLAEYFRSQQRSSEIQAREERQEWARLSLALPTSKKYQKPQDSSRYRHEYFSHEAAEMDALAREYIELGSVVAK